MKALNLRIELVATGEHIEEVVELSPALIAKGLMELGYDLAVLGPAISYPREAVYAAGALRIVATEEP